MTTRFNEKLQFNCMSISNFQTRSCLGEGAAHWGPFSINATQGATAGYLLNVSAPTVDNLAQVLQRLCTTIFEKQPS
jgi:hypothetical protein